MYAPAPPGAHRLRPLRLAARPAHLQFRNQLSSLSRLLPPFLSRQYCRPPWSPLLLPSNWWSGLPVFCQCSNPCLPPGLHLPAPRTRQDQESLPTARLYPSAIGFRGCLSALCSPILTVSYPDWPSYNQLARAIDPSSGSLGECARRGRGDWRRRRQRRRVPVGERARGAQGGAGWRRRREASAPWTEPERGTALSWVPGRRRTRRGCDSSVAGAERGQSSTVPHTLCLVSSEGPHGQI